MKSLKDYDGIKGFMELLEYQGMTHEMNQLEFIIDYVDKTERQLDAVLSELQHVRMELGTIQQKNIKTTAVRMVDNVINTVNIGKESITKTKTFIKCTIEQGVKEFKSKGKDALVSTMKNLNINGLLQKCLHCFNSIHQSADKSIDALTNLGNEVHQVNSHVLNIGRIMIGKDPIATRKRNHDKGIISITQHGLFKVMEKMSNLSIKTKENIRKLDEKINELNTKESVQKKSVKKSLKKFKNVASEKDCKKIMQNER